MSVNKKYVLDTNVFIESHKRYYAPDLAPTFWSKLIRGAEDGHIESIDRVKKELDRETDKVRRWANDKFDEWFKPTRRQDVVDSRNEILKWVEKADYKTSARDEFIREDNADSWLIAFAMVTKSIVVTNEKFKENNRKKIQIPNVCEEFKIKSIDQYKMMRELKITLCEE